MKTIKERLRSQTSVSDQPHYTRSKMQHILYAGLNGFDWWQGNITKYVHRWRYKNGAEDLKKVLDYISHYIHCNAQEFDSGRCLTPKEIKPALEDFYARLIKEQPYRCKSARGEEERTI